jgi:hypothetical protein
MERCSVGTYDLTAEDAEAFIQAHNKYLTELGIGQRVNDVLYQSEIEQGRLRILRPQPEG